MSIYTDSGVTLFQGGVARSVTFAPTTTYTAGTTGNAVYVDGAPITGASATMQPSRELLRASRRSGITPASLIKLSSMELQKL